VGWILDRPGPTRPTSHREVQANVVNKEDALLGHACATDVQSQTSQVQSIKPIILTKAIYQTRHRQRYNLARSTRLTHNTKFANFIPWFVFVNKRYHSSTVHYTFHLVIAGNQSNYERPYAWSTSFWYCCNMPLRLSFWAAVVRPCV
jgi:hypothetical protein